MCEALRVPKSCWYGKHPAERPKALNHQAGHLAYPPIKFQVYPYKNSMIECLIDVCEGLMNPTLMLLRQTSRTWTEKCSPIGQGVYPYSLLSSKRMPVKNSMIEYLISVCGVFACRSPVGRPGKRQARGSAGARWVGVGRCF